MIIFMRKPCNDIRSEEDSKTDLPPTIAFDQEKLARLDRIRDLEKDTLKIICNVDIPEGIEVNNLCYLEGTLFKAQAFENVYIFITYGTTVPFIAYITGEAAAANSHLLHGGAKKVAIQGSFSGLTGALLIERLEEQSESDLDD